MKPPSRSRTSCGYLESIRWSLDKKSIKTAVDIFTSRSSWNADAMYAVPISSISAMKAPFITASMRR